MKDDMHIPENVKCLKAGALLEKAVQTHLEGCRACEELWDMSILA